MAFNISQFIKDKKESLFKRETPELSISMMGPRSVGKTTVLTSIFHESKSSIAGTKVGIRPGDTNTGKLDNYFTMLTNAITPGNANNLPASNTESVFRFDLVRLGKSEPNVKIKIQDFPGEYLTDSNTENNDKVSKFLGDATVILIAVDTPFLMEDGGKYNMQKNMVDLVTKYFTKDPEAVKNKLVLFVPLKCERYYYDDRLDEVARKVKVTYGKLIEFFKQNNIASVVTPILTLGGIELDHMADMTGKDGITIRNAVYRTYADDPEYAPKYCSQPLYYLLSYVSSYYAWMKQNKKATIWEKIKMSIFSSIYKDDDFAAEMRKLSNFIVNGENGFETVTTNSILNIH